MDVKKLLAGIFLIGIGGIVAGYEIGLMITANKTPDGSGMIMAGAVIGFGVAVFKDSK